MGRRAEARGPRHGPGPRALLPDRHAVGAVARGWNGPDGTWIGSYVIRYERGAGNWRATPADLATPPDAVVWQGTNAAKQAVQLCKQRWSNPRPELEIQTLDFVCKMTRSAPLPHPHHGGALRKNSGD